MKYIDTEKLITAIEERLKNIHDYINGTGMKYKGPKFYKARGKESAYDGLLSIIYFLQQEQPERPDFDDVDPNHLVHSHYTKVRETKTGRVFWAEYSSEAAEWYEAGTGKAYSISDIEIVKVQPEGLHFTPLNRLIQKIPSEKWNDSTNNYAKKLRDCLIKEGYLKDASVLQGYISYMNGNNVPMATMDKQEHPEVDLEKHLKEYCLAYYNCKYPEQITNGTCDPVMVHIVSAARHFYELGLNARKEDTK